MKIIRDWSYFCFEGVFGREFQILSLLFPGVPPPIDPQNYERSEDGKEIYSSQNIKPSAKRYWIGLLLRFVGLHSSLWWLMILGDSGGFWVIFKLLIPCFAPFIGKWTFQPPFSAHFPMVFFSRDRNDINGVIFREECS